MKKKLTKGAALALLAGFAAAAVVRAGPAAEGEKAPAGDGEAGAGAAASIVWLHAFDEAVARARAASRPLLIDFEAEWCGWCKKLDRETYGDADVIRFVTETFVAAKIDADKAPEVMKRFSVSGLPTIVFLDPGGDSSTPSGSGAVQELGRIEGFRPPELFLAEARKAVLAGKSLEALREAAAKHPKDADAQRAFARALLAGGKGAAAEKVLRDALARIPGSPVLLYEIAEIDRLAGRFEKAAAAYRRILEAPGAPAEVRKEVPVPLARCLISLGETAAAEKALGTLLEGAAETVRSRAARREAEELEKPEKPEKPEGPGDAEGRREPLLDATVLEGLFLRGYVRALLERPKEALEDLRLARDADPDGPWGFRASFIIARLRT